MESPLQEFQLLALRDGAIFRASLNEEVSMKMFSVLSLLSLALVAMVGQTALALPAKSISNKYSFTISSNWDFGGHVYFNCNSVEDFATAMLEKMGARNVKASCTGGIDNGGNMPPMEAYLSVSYDSVKAASAGDAQTIQADYSSVELRGFDDCFLARQLFKKFQPTFDIKNLSTPHSCSNPGGSYLYRFDVLK